jgi:hypothetical protein
MIAGAQHRLRLPPSAAKRPGGASTGTAGRAGKSISSNSAARRVTRSVPAFMVRKLTLSRCGSKNWNTM